MITSGSLPNFEDSFYSVDITVNSPISGFEFSLMETGVDGTFKSANMITMSGQEGYLFDQSGNFFGGYQSGVPFNLQIYYDKGNTSFSYYYKDIYSLVYSQIVMSSKIVPSAVLLFKPPPM